MTSQRVVLRRVLKSQEGIRPERLFAMADLPLYAFVATIPFETVGTTGAEGLSLTVSWVLALIWAISCLLQGRIHLFRYDRGILSTALFIMCVAARGSFVDSSLRPEVTQLVLTLVQMNVMFWLIINCARQRPNFYESIGWVYGLSCSLFGVLQTVGVTASHFGQDNRVTGLWENPNTFAGKLVIGLVLVIGLLWNRKRTPLWITLPVVVTWPCSIFAIMRSGSRGALLSLCMGLFLLAYSRTSLYGTALSRLASLVLAAGLAGLVVYSITQTATVMTRWRRTLDTGDMATREAVYPRILEMISQKPFFGWGPVENYHASGEIAGSSLPRSTENTILWSLSAVGLLGATPFLYVLYLAVVSAWRLRHTQLRWTPIAVLITTLAFASTIEWYHVKVFWLVLAIGIAAASNMPRRRSYMMTGHFGSRRLPICR